MDNVDTAILSELRKDARISLQLLAGRVGVSRATVRSRMTAMQARGDITGFTVTTPADMVRSPVRGLMLLAIEGAGTDRLAHRLAGMPQVVAVHTTNGKWDLILEIGTSTLEALDRVLSEIRMLPGISSSETNLLLSTRGLSRQR